MNPYLSRDEKEGFVRVMALAELLGGVVDGYTKSKSIDREFLKYMRMGHSLIRKAMEMRVNDLEDKAKEEFSRQAAGLEFICVPKPDARKYYDEIMALKSTLPMELDDFADWYGEVFEKTCKLCHNNEFKECAIRRVLMKYGVYPVDETAVDKCQYKYSGARNAESVDLTLVSAGGGTASVSVSAELAESILGELRDRNDYSRGICAAHVADKLVCIDTRGDVGA